MLESLFRRRRLPHWDVEDATYFITACLAGSVPAEGLTRLRRYRDELEHRPRPVTITIEEWEYRKHKLIFSKFDDIIDADSAVRHLASPAAASEVEKSLRHFAGERYDLLAFAVMPSHFHWLFRPQPKWVQTCIDESQRTGASKLRTAHERIVQSAKGYSARRCNQLLGLSGQFWQDESYDHVVRNDEELFRIIDYVENNPVKAGLVARREDWRWSSAYHRVPPWDCIGSAFAERLS